jgi:charged multivesicular body protein 2A
MAACGIPPYIRLHLLTKPLAALLSLALISPSDSSSPQAMRVMNKRLNLPNMQKVLMEFERQNERMEMTSDMMGDAIDDAMEVRV